ncbi:hypothetical protein Vretimale_11496 [Volvox reticuliferus]|uniref:CRM domain-containing protein n=1 Tax=Volvox reticuliferus TaxID=1737510 RepID=A0A8J4FS32_9CHLO|nr:hypothetical protein Vretifemale_14901 [Volvox reticuliferus]GIM07398.1 hypothetical protein Vretimale_11496 [Volvox reticuliferus]
MMPVRARWLYAPGRTWNIGMEVLDGPNLRFIADSLRTIRCAADVLLDASESTSNRGWSQPSASCSDHGWCNDERDMPRPGRAERPCTPSCSCTAYARPAAANDLTPTHVSRPACDTALEIFLPFNRGGPSVVHAVRLPLPPANTVCLHPLTTRHERNLRRHQAIGTLDCPKHLSGICLSLSGSTITPRGSSALRAVYGFSSSTRGGQSPAGNSPRPAPASAIASEGETRMQTAASAATTAAAGAPPRQERVPPSQLPAAPQAGAEAAGPLERIPILPPRQRHQPPLSRDVSKYLWRNAEELAAAGKLLRLQVGKAGATRALMARMGHLLEHHQLIRVSLLQNCPLDVRFVAWLAENALDCVCIKVKGRTATLFRQKGLPRPPASFPTDSSEQQHHHPAAAAVRGGSSLQIPDDAQEAAPGPTLPPPPLPLAAVPIKSGVPATLPGMDAADAQQLPSSQPPRCQELPNVAQLVRASREGESESGNAGLHLTGHTGIPYEGRPDADSVKQRQAQDQVHVQGLTTDMSAGVDGGAGVEADAVVGSYRAALAARFRQWWATRDTRRLRLGVRRP